MHIVDFSVHKIAKRNLVTGLSQQRLLTLHNRLRGLEFERTDPDSFVSKKQVADYLSAYATPFDAPIRTGMDGSRLQRKVTP